MSNIFVPGVALAVIVWMLVYLWCVKPNRVTKQREMAIRPFTERLIAHRGLFDRELSIPENTMIAFERAVSYGFGIELDVRLTKDCEMVVFHDATLKRMCGVNKAVSELTYQELCRYPLDHTGQRIPRLEDVLKLVSGKVPLIIEIKAEKNGSLAAQLLCEKLRDSQYRGAYCVESFYPFALQWLRVHEPDVIRGQLVTDVKSDGKRRGILAAIFLNGLLLNVCSRPDFIAYNYKFAFDIKYRIMRALFRFTSAGWTIRSEQELKAVREVFQIIIFDHFIPDDVCP